jgi:hypothetical protein
MSEGFSIESEESSNSSSASYPGSKEREIVSDFISNMFEEERENQDKKIVGNFIDSLLEEEKPKTNMKKINNKRSKNKVVKNYLPSNKKQKNSAKNNKKNNNIIQDNSQEKTIDTNMYRNTLIKKILNINKHKNNYERNKSTEIRQKNININDGNGSAKKINKKNNSTKKRIIKNNDYNYPNERRNKTIDLSSEENYGEKFKAKLESEKERKECEEKIRILKNHISAMKRQQDNMNKKMLILKNKENMINSAKKMKEKSKRNIYEYKIIKRAELEKKKKNIIKQREEMNKGVKEAMEKIKLEKSNKYKLYQKEKKELSKEKERNNAKKIIEQIEKIKAIREINKNVSFNRRRLLNQNYNDVNEKQYENNIQKTKLLKEQIKQLLEEEDECLEKLNKTKSKFDIMTSSDRYSSVGHKPIKTNHKPTTEPFYLE